MADARQGPGERVALGLELEQAREQLAEDVDAGQPPGDAAEQGDGRQLTVQVAVGAEESQRGAQGLDRVAGADQGRVQPGGEGGAACPGGGGRQVREPAGEALGGRSAGAQAGGAEDARDHVVEARVGGERERVVEAAAGEVVGDGPPADLAAVVVGQRQGRVRAPQWVGNTPTPVVGCDERHAVEDGAQVDRLVEGGAGEVVVGPAEIGDHRQHVAAGLAERGEHLLPQVVVGTVPGHAGGQLGHRRPAARRPERPHVADPPVGGEARHLLVGEAQVVVADVEHLALGAQPGEGHRRVGATRQEHVAVRRQGVDQVGQPPRARRPRRQQVDVVEHQAHRGRAAPPDRVGHRLGLRSCGAGPPVARAGGAVHRGERVVGERFAVGVAGLDPDPDVIAARGQAVLCDGLGQQRRLSEPRSADHGRHTVLPAPQQGPQQARAGERQRPRAGWLEPKRSRHRRRGYEAEARDARRGRSCPLSRRYAGANEAHARWTHPAERRGPPLADGGGPQLRHARTVADEAHGTHPSGRDRGRHHPHLVVLPRRRAGAGCHGEPVPRAGRAAPALPHRPAGQLPRHARRSGEDPAARAAPVAVVRARRGRRMRGAGRVPDRLPPDGGRLRGARVRAVAGRPPRGAHAPLAGPRRGARPRGAPGGGDPHPACAPQPGGPGPVRGDHGDTAVRRPVHPAGPSAAPHVGMPDRARPRRRGRAAQRPAGALRARRARPPRRVRAAHPGHHARHVVRGRRFRRPPRAGRRMAVPYPGPPRGRSPPPAGSAANPSDPGGEVLPSRRPGPGPSPAEMVRVPRRPDSPLAASSSSTQLRLRPPRPCRDESTRNPQPFRRAP